MLWKIKMLLTLHILVGLTILSLFLEPVNSLWVPIDQGFFQLANSWIKESFFWQNFWAIANHRLADFLLEDLGFLFLFFWIIYATPAALRQRKTAECLFILIYGAFIILIANEFLFRNLLHIERKSPTLVMDTFTNLSDTVTWLKIKTKSYKSFPGDHATTAILSIVGFFFLAREQRTVRIITLFFGLFLALPRLIVGAHWLTDVLIGSGSIIAICFGWAFCTPLASSCIHIVDRGLDKLRIFRVSESL